MSGGPLWEPRCYRASLRNCARVAARSGKSIRASEEGWIVCLFGSARESGETCDLRGFSSFVQFDSRSRRRCGNVGTRVLCGFPSSEGGQNRWGRRSIIPPSERHFHSEAPVYRPFWRESAVWAAGGAKYLPFRKPRRMHVLTD